MDYEENAIPWIPFRPRRRRHEEDALAHYGITEIPTMILVMDTETSPR